MKIGELARRVGVATSKIRFLEARGVLRSQRLANGYREYGEEAVALLQIILQGQAVGFTLDEIHKAMGEAQGHDLSCADMLDQLRLKLAELDRHIAQSIAVRDRLDLMITALAARGAGDDHAPMDLRMPLDLPGVAA
jgi:DNA-binding transcriptional MerR regulator